MGLRAHRGDRGRSRPVRRRDGREFPVRVRAIWAGVEYHLFTGFIDTWGDPGTYYGPRYAETTATATDGFKILAGITLPAQAATGAGEPSGNRISRILTAAGWYTDHRNIAAGDSELQATTFGDTALNLLQLTADTEIGELYIDGSGNVVYRHRQGILEDARSTTPQGVFGDQAEDVRARANHRFSFERKAAAQFAQQLLFGYRLVDYKGSRRPHIDDAMPYQSLGDPAWAEGPVTTNVHAL